MKLFLDTNVVLDWILNRNHAFGDEALEILIGAENKKFELYMAGGSVYTIAYVLEKSGLKGNKLRQTLLKILSLIEVIPDHSTFYKEGCISSFRDMEDAFQYHIALSNKKLNYFVTGNTKDYKEFSVPILPVQNPKEIIKMFSAN